MLSIRAFFVVSELRHAPCRDSFLHWASTHAPLSSTP